MKIAQQTLKMVGFVLLVTGYTATSSIVILCSRDEWARRRRLTRVIAFYSRLTLRLLGVDMIHIARRQNEAHADAVHVGGVAGRLIVANHLSYLDVLLVAATHPVAFVTSVEIRDTPFLGQLSLLGGCLYVERRNRENLNQEVRELTVGLQKGLDICVFPEATSTNGDAVLRFRRPLFQAAIDSRTQVLPVTINYAFIDAKVTDHRNRDLIAWYGDMDFLPHLWNLMGLSEIQVSLRYETPLSAGEFTSTQDLSSQAHAQVAKNFISLAAHSREERFFDELPTEIAPRGAHI